MDECVYGCDEPTVATNPADDTRYCKECAELAQALGDILIWDEA